MVMREKPKNKNGTTDLNGYIRVELILFKYSTAKVLSYNMKWCSFCFLDCTNL